MPLLPIRFSNTAGFVVAAGSLQLFASPVLAAGGDPVLLVVDDANESLASRIDSELGGGGFAVTVVRKTEPLDHAALLDLARHAGAKAVVTVAATPAEVDVWLVVPRSDIDLQKVEHDAVAADARADVVAVRTVEALHARLIHIDERVKTILPICPAPPPPVIVSTATAPTPCAAPPEPGHPWGSLALGLAVWGTPGGVSPSLDLWAEAAWNVRPRFHLQSFVSVGITSSTVTGSEGSANLAASLLGVGGTYAFVIDGPLRPSLTIGIAGLRLTMDGITKPPYIGSTETSLSAVPFIEPSCDWMLSEHVGLRLSGWLGTTAPKPVVAFAGREVASWGAPLLGLALGPVFLAGQ